MKLLWRSGRRRGKADGKEKEKDIRESRKPWSGITAQKVEYRGSVVFSNVCAGSADSKKGGECRCVGITA